LQDTKLENCQTLKEATFGASTLYEVRHTFIRFISYLYMAKWFCPVVCWRHMIIHCFLCVYF